MLTPDFKLSQTEQQIIVVLRLPYVKISACEFYIQQNCFKFYLKPYLLSLDFQSSLEQAQQPSKATYYHDKHLLEVHLKKKNKGEHFNNLNLLSNVLSKRKEEKGKKKGNLIEVVGEESQIIETNSNQNKIINAFSYGFCNNYSSLFRNLEQQCLQLFSFDPEAIAISERFNLSEQISESYIDEDAYLFDKFQNQQIKSILQSNQMENQVKRLMKNFRQAAELSQQKNQKLPHKELLVDCSLSKNIPKQLVSISFSFLYELCCMDGQFSVESAKTINNTCSVLNCCVDYSNLTVQEVIKNSSKRCIIYSLYKHIEICQKVRKFLATNFNNQFLCTMLKQLRSMFNKSQPRYLLNTIFIDDYLIYCMKAEIDRQLCEMREMLMKFQIKESDLGVDMQQGCEQNEEEDRKEQENGMKLGQKNERVIEQLEKVEKVENKQ